MNRQKKKNRRNSGKPTLFPLMLASLAVLWTAAGIPLFVTFYKPPGWWVYGEDAVLSLFVKVIPWLTAFAISGAVMMVLCLANAINQGRIARQTSVPRRLIRRPKQVTSKRTIQVIFFAVGALFWLVFFIWNLASLLRLKPTLSLDTIY